MLKMTLCLGMVSLGIAVSGASGMTELETLRARCSEQQRQIRRLEEENLKLRADKPEAVAPVERPAAVAGTPAKAAAEDGATDTVRAGDNLEKIARRNGCSATKLAKANGLEASSIIRPGQILKLPGKSATRSAPDSPPASRTPDATVGAGKTYKIQDDDTYASIARKFGLSVDALVAANPDAKPTALHTGQVIHLVDKAASATPQSKPVAEKPSAPPSEKSPPVEKSPSPPKTTEATTAGQSEPAPKTPAETATAPDPGAAANTEKKTHPVKIEKEMTYGEFATKHGTTITRLNDLNGLDLTKATILAKGSELYVPGKP